MMESTSAHSAWRTSPRLANSPMMRASLVSRTSGRTAKGSCTDCSTLRYSSASSPAVGFAWQSSATATAGPSASARVRRVRFHLSIRRERNPSMMYCPASVPVMVLLCPAASSPMAQVNLADDPGSRLCNASPATLKPTASHTPDPPPASQLIGVKRRSAVAMLRGTQARPRTAHSSAKKPFEKQQSTAALMRKETLSARADSTALYMLACDTCAARVWSTLRL
mmetsp:Transcript_30999/g.77539  ORF Transcript_30999/g.77539 Transcript_30999/m.77539 type:complete len:224 (-) Transcript_30999:973-1644(-)